jgi:hypothetical protein
MHQWRGSAATEQPLWDCVAHSREHAPLGPAQWHSSRVEPVGPVWLSELGLGTFHAAWLVWQLAQWELYLTIRAMLNRSAPKDNKLGPVRAQHDGSWNMPAPSPLCQAWHNSLSQVQTDPPVDGLCSPRWLSRHGPSLYCYNTSLYQQFKTLYSNRQTKDTFGRRYCRV